MYNEIKQQHVISLHHHSVGDQQSVERSVLITILRQLFSVYLSQVSQSDHSLLARGGSPEMTCL